MCEGDSLVLTASPGYVSYFWSPGGETTQSIVVRQSGTYTVTGRLPGGVDRTSAAVTITVSPRPVVAISASGPLVLCQGQSVTLDAGPGFAQYLWSTGETRRSITVSTPGTYQVSVRTGAGCSATSAPVSVLVTQISISIQASGPLTLCQGSSVTLDAGSGFARYRWSNGAATRSIIVTQAGLYTVTVWTPDSCSATSAPVQVNVTSTLNPVITASKSGILCPGDSVVLDAGSGFASYRWSTGETSRQIIVRTAGSFIVTVTSANGCTGTSAQHIVMMAQVPVITPTGPIHICIGGSVTLDAGAGYATYRWSTGATTRTIQVSSSGTYSVSVTLGNCQLTSNAVVVSVVASLQPTITASGPISFCDSGSVVLTADPGYAVYRWNTGATTQSITVTASGVYVCTVQDPNGCSGISQPIVVTVHPRPTPVITPSTATLCLGDSIELDAGGGYAVYEWSTGERTQTIHVKSGGSYSVRVTDGNGCSGTSTAVTVTVQRRPATPVITRSGDVLMATKAGRYQWYKDGLPMPGETNQFLLVKEPGSYTVEVFDEENGCGAMSFVHEVLVLDVEALPDAATFSVHPDPHDGVFVVSGCTPGARDIVITVTNVLGAAVRRITATSTDGMFRQTVDITSAPSGMYLVSIQTGRSHEILRVVRR